jgi:hypothetical protein
MSGFPAIGLDVEWTRAEKDALSIKLGNLGLMLRGASRANDLYKYRISPDGDKKVLAHFNTLEEINNYLDELSATIGD